MYSNHGDSESLELRLLGYEGGQGAQMIGYLDKRSMKKSVNDKLYEFDMNISFSKPLLVNGSYALDLSKDCNFSIESIDSSSKSIIFNNVPNTPGVIVSTSIRFKSTVVCPLNFPASVLWQDGIAPTFNTGKQYILNFISYDNGVSWLSSCIGEW